MKLKINNLKVDGAGEGSRGGKVIGHTKSGKPVYMKHGHPSHGDFTKSEHVEAATMHHKASADLSWKKGQRLVGEDKKLFNSHIRERRKHASSAGGK